MTEHPRVRLARLFGLTLAFDLRGIERPQFLLRGTIPKIPGHWRMYRF